MIHYNIDMPDDLHRDLKVRAALERKTMKALIIEFLYGSLVAFPERSEERASRREGQTR